MNKIDLSKLGITPLEQYYNRILELDLFSTHEIRKVEADRDEMLVALIEEWQFIESYLASNASIMEKYDYKDFVEKQNPIVKIIEKATKKSWAEIKELLI